MELNRTVRIERQDGAPVITDSLFDVQEWEFVTNTQDGEEAEQIPHANDLLLKVEEDLQSDAPFSYTTERNIVDVLLPLLIVEEYSTRATKCLVQFIRTKLSTIPIMCDIADTLCDYFITQEQVSNLAFEAIKKVIAEMPTIDTINFYKGSKSGQLALALIDSLAPRITAGISEKNVENSVQLMKMLLRQFGYLVKNHTKYGNMNFWGDYFCTGVELGKGSYANVFLGRHMKTAQVVAIKMMDWDKLTRGKPKLAQHLENEISIMKSSNSDNIVRLYDVVRDGINLNLMLEYCSGGSLEEYLAKKGPLVEEEVLHWVHELAGGLKFLHDRNIVHRDLKPGNLLLSVDHPTANLKITDFTFARFLEPGDMAVSMVGTPLYMAPEILFHKKYTEKADLWSVGVIIYQMLTGKLPFKGKTYLELMSNLRMDLTWPTWLSVSADMKDLVQSLLQKDANLRISWTEFFLHPSVNLGSVSSTSGSGKTSLKASVSILGEVAGIKELEDARNEIARLRKELADAKEQLSHRDIILTEGKSDDDTLDSVSFTSCTDISDTLNSVVVTRKSEGEIQKEKELARVKQQQNEAEKEKERDLEREIREREKDAQIARLMAELDAVKRESGLKDLRLQAALESVEKKGAEVKALEEVRNDIERKLDDVRKRLISIAGARVNDLNQLSTTTADLEKEKQQTAELRARVAELEKDLDVCRLVLKLEAEEGGKSLSRFIP